ncbi:hypothetical protein [Pedobacter sp. NJ-S-72]
MKSIIIQITSGQGPEECCRVVAKVQEMLIKQAKQLNIQIEVLENTKGDLNGTTEPYVLLFYWQRPKTCLILSKNGMDQFYGLHKAHTAGSINAKTGMLA